MSYVGKGCWEILKLWHLTGKYNIQNLNVSEVGSTFILYWWFYNYKLIYRELSKKAQKANNVWWRLSGLLGDQNRMLMYILLQAVFTVATMALTVPIFLSYRLHVVFQILKVSAAVWNGGSFLLEVMPRQVIMKEKKKTEMKPLEQQSSPVTENTSSETEQSWKYVSVGISWGLGLVL